MPDIPTIVAFLHKLHLFRDLKEDELEEIAQSLEEKKYEPQEVVLKQGEEGNQFFIISSGKVKVTRKTLGQEKVIGLRMERDYFGEEALLHKVRRTATIVAEEKTTALILSREAFHKLLKTMPQLRLRFKVSVDSHRLGRRKTFQWLETDKGETIYLILRKHKLILLQAVFGPALLVVISLVLLAVSVLILDSIILYIVSLVFLLGTGAYIAWLVVDWGNDYYIVTNRRIVYIEKIIGLYDSRLEAPLAAILSVNTNKDVSGRVIGFGDVVVRTFVGTITFQSVGDPEEVEALVRELWDRTKDISRRSNIEALKKDIQRKLGQLPPLPPPPPKPPPTNKKTNYGPMLRSNPFKVRFEEKGVITYRKHWFVLFEQSWLPAVLGILVLVWLFYSLINGWIVEKILSVDAGIGLLTIAFFGMLGWWVYEYVDWNNDIFQVSADQIIDIDKTPLGSIQRNVAPLDNILNMEAKREGFLQVLFNYGNVYITVGGTKMVFENVVNPAAVQQDIDNRRVARREKQEQDRANAERDRLAEFFAMYHTEFRGQTEDKSQETDSGKQPPS